MDTPTLVYKYQLELDKLDSQDYRDLPLPTKLQLLNKGILIYVKEVYGLDNKYNLGFEGNEKRIDDLQVLVEKQEGDISYVSNSSEDNSFYADFSSLVPNKYLHLIRSFSYADKGSCTDRVLYDQLSTHDELNEVLPDPNSNGSFEWQELPIILSNNKIFAYSDGTFTPKRLHMEYLKYPTKIDIIGYTHINGDASTNKDSELQDYVLEDIISATAQLTKIILGDVMGTQLSNIKINSEI